MPKTMKPLTVNILISIFVVFLIACAIFLYAERQKLSGQLAHLRQMTQTRSDSISANWHRLMLLDDTLFSGDDRQALVGYQKLLPAASAAEKSKIQARIDYLQRSAGNKEQSPGIEPVHALSQHNTDSVILLDRKNDSLRSSYDKLTDSLENKISELNRQISNRNRALNNRDLLQVKTFENAEGQVIHYIGETKEEMANGSGTGIWQKSGGVYKGDWQNNQRHGYGVYTWADGERYEGNFTNDKREGQGIYHWPSGERYEGAWKNSRRHGNGVLYDPDGNISYDGLWEADKPKK